MDNHVCKHIVFSVSRTQMKNQNDHL